MKAPASTFDDINPSGKLGASDRPIGGFNTIDWGIKWLVALLKNCVATVHANFVNLSLIATDWSER